MVKVHMYKSGEFGILANAYAVETENSLVAIDTTFTVSEARAFGRLLASLQKPVAAVLVTHAHPDHIAGLSVWLTDPATPVYALASVDRLLRKIEESKRRQWQPLFKEEWVTPWIYPNRLINNGDTVTVDGTHFQVHDLGPGGDCDANSIWIMNDQPPSVFAGDLVYNGTHSWLADGRTIEWLRNLDRVRSLVPEDSVFYPGHGEPGNRTLLDKQATYLKLFREAVRNLSGGQAVLDENQGAELMRRMEQLVPGGKLSFMVDLAANPVAAELATEATAAKTA